MATSGKQREKSSKCTPSCPALSAKLDDTRCWVLWDKALGLMIQHEESLLGDVLTQVRDLTQIAQEQAQVMVDFIENDN